MSDGQIIITAKTDLTQAEQDINNFSKRSQIALNNLNYVVQDLPYGFIGIQNNLPPLIASFRNLVEEEKGVTNAFKSLGATILSPTGIAFGFSIIISSITALVQKYGSLGKAFDALVGSSKALTDEQKKIIDNVAEESTKVLTLYGLYNNLNDNRELQLKVLKKLTDAAPAYFTNLKTEEDRYTAVSGAIDKYINSLLGKIFVETQQAKVTEILKTYAEQLSKVVDTEINLAKQRDSQKNSLKNQVELIERLGKSQKTLTDIQVGVKPVLIKKTTEELVKDIRDSLKKDITELFGATGKFSEVLNIDSIFGADKKAPKGKAEKEIKDRFDFLVTQIDKSLIPVSKFKGKLSEALEFKFKRGKPEIPTFESLLPSNILEQRKNLEEIAQGYLRAKTLIENTFFKPLEELFTNFLTTGKLTFKEFGKSLLTMIAQIAAKLAATAIVEKLGSLFAQSTGFGGTLSDSGIFSGLGRLISGGVTKPSFGKVGAMNGTQISGQVNMVLRGIDLVGSINRTNAVINRIG
jgi:hypothetical protein